MSEGRRITIIGLTITSSWGNGHATTWRALVRALARRGHEVTFLEQDAPWYAAHRDLPHPDFCTVHLYRSAEDLRERFAAHVRDSDLVIVGSFVPDGVDVGEWVTRQADGVAAFYDIDTPVTLSRVQRHGCAYLSCELISRYDLYLSFTGGPTLRRLEETCGSPMARALYCSVDPDLYHPVDRDTRWDLGYLGTYSEDRQPGVTELLVEPARFTKDRRFVVAGPQYPAEIRWPDNVERLEHVPPGEHANFYGRQRFTLNITRADMKAAGWSPSVRLFEAAACGIPIISDTWPGIDELFEPGREIILARDRCDVLHALDDIDDRERRAIGEAARRRILQSHTSERRAAELEAYLEEAERTPPRANRRTRLRRLHSPAGARSRGAAKGAP